MSRFGDAHHLEPRVAVPEPATHAACAIDGVVIGREDVPGDQAVSTLTLLFRTALAAAPTLSVS